MRKLNKTTGVVKTKRRVPGSGSSAMEKTNSSRLLDLNLYFSCVKFVDAARGGFQTSLSVGTTPVAYLLAMSPICNIVAM
jgi:hypothetical protein